MTKTTRQSVIQKLNDQGIPAHAGDFGCITISTNGPQHYEFGDVAETIMGNLLDFDDNCDETFESAIPSDSEDVDAISGFIAESVRQSSELTFSWFTTPNP